MRRIIVMSVAMLFIVFLSNVAFAHCGACGTLEDGTAGMVVVSVGEKGSGTDSAQEGEIINDTCPIMEGEVDNSTPYKVEYNGEIIGFCCPNCVEEFKSNPEKYMTKLKEMQSAKEDKGSHEDHMH